MLFPFFFFFFFFNDTATTEIYTLSLHDALPISRPLEGALGPPGAGRRDHLSDLGRRRLASPHRLRRPARGQACPRSPTRAPGLTPANGSRLAVIATCTLELSNGRLLLVETRAFSCGVPSSYPPPCFGTRS